VIGLTVNRLIRISYGPFLLGALAPGEVDEVKPKVLADQLGSSKSTPGPKKGPRPVARKRLNQRKLTKRLP